MLRQRGFVAPQPHKRPRSSWVRFEASLPNQCWQSDVTRWHLAEETEVELRLPGRSLQTGRGLDGDEDATPPRCWRRSRMTGAIRPHGIGPGCRGLSYGVLVKSLLRR
jgi:hypothetical protein